MVSFYTLSLVQTVDQTIRGFRIGIIANTAWNLYHFRADLIRHLRGHENKVYGIAPADGFESRLEEICDGYEELKKLQRKGTNAFSDLALYHELVAIMKRQQLDVVLCYTVKPNIYGTLAAHRLGIPVVNTITGLGFTFLENRLINKVVVRLYKYALEKSSRVIFQNKDDRHLFIRKGIAKAGNTSLIRGSGIDVEKFHPKLNVLSSNGKLNFIFIGRLLYDKGVMELLQGFAKAAEELTHISLHLVGDTDEGNPASVSAEDLALYHHRDDIHFHGYQENIIPYLAKSDVVILPSYREGMPRVLLEGMSMAKPVIATSVPGCKDMVKNGVNGYLVKVKSADEIADAITGMARLSADERAAMGEAGRRNVVEHYSSNAIIMEYDMVLRDLMGDKKKRKSDII